MRTGLSAGEQAHPALLVHDLSSLMALSEAGMQIVDDEPLEGYRRMSTTDPFGTAWS